MVIGQGLFEKAKKRSLPDFAQMYGFNLKRIGDRFAANCCPHCNNQQHGAGQELSMRMEGGIWRWKCFRCQDRGGSIIDFAAAVWGLTLTEAAKRLADNEEVFRVSPKAFASVKAKTNPEILASALKRISLNSRTSESKCVEYLESRGLSVVIINKALKIGLLGFLPSNPVTANDKLLQMVGLNDMRESGLVKQDANFSCISYRPICYFFPGFDAAEFRLARDSEKSENKFVAFGEPQLPYWWQAESGRENTHCIHVVEGAIDLLSRVALGIDKQDAVMAVPGVNRWKEDWFQRIQLAYPKAKLVLSLDNDVAGFNATERMKLTLDALKMPYEVSYPDKKDWNETLKS